MKDRLFTLSCAVVAVAFLAITTIWLGVLVEIARIVTR